MAFGLELIGGFLSWHVHIKAWELRTFQVVSRRPVTPWFLRTVDESKAGTLEAAGRAIRVCARVCVPTNERCASVYGVCMNPHGVRQSSVIAVTEEMKRSSLALVY